MSKNSYPVWILFCIFFVSTDKFDFRTGTANYSHVLGHCK